MLSRRNSLDSTPFWDGQGVAPPRPSERVSVACVFEHGYESHLRAVVVGMVVRSTVHVDVTFLCDKHCGIERNV